MAQKTVVTVVCDLPHDGEVEGTETVSFAFDGTAYEIDVCSTHAKDLREKFGKYVEHSRRAAGGGRWPSAPLAQWSGPRAQFGN